MSACLLSPVILKLSLLGPFVVCMIQNITMDADLHSRREVSQCSKRTKKLTSEDKDKINSSEIKQNWCKLAANDVIREHSMACMLTRTGKLRERGCWLKFSAELFREESTSVAAKNSAGCSLHSVAPPRHGLLEAAALVIIPVSWKPVPSVSNSWIS